MKKYINYDSCILTNEYVDYMESKTLSLERTRQYTEELRKSNKAKKKLLNEREKELSGITRLEGREIRIARNAHILKGITK